jgi:hypothetical protein
MKLLEYMDNGTELICDAYGNIFVRRLSRYMYNAIEIFYFAATGMSEVKKYTRFMLCIR